MAKSVNLVLRYRLILQAAAAFLFLEGCHFLAWRGLEPFASWFYVLAWWPYILIIDTIIFALKGESPLRNHPRQVAAMLPWSVFIWLVFELFNLRLDNWHYVNVTGVLWLRWAGYFLSFATVLPGIFMTAELLGALGLFAGRRLPAIPASTAWYPWFRAAGVLCGLLPLLWPRYFFPLVWGTFVFGLEPSLHAAYRRHGLEVSLMADLERGDPRRILRLLAAGAVCGLLWEFWNFWARTKWIYTVPFVSGLKLFEMPVAGFLGFPPFALECFVMYNFIRLHLGDLSEPTRAGAAGRAGLVVSAALVAAMCLVAFSAMDRLTVYSYVK